MLSVQGSAKRRRPGCELRECCRQAQAEAVSNSSNKFTKPGKSLLAELCMALEGGDVMGVKRSFISHGKSQKKSCESDQRTRLRKDSNLNSLHT